MAPEGSDPPGSDPSGGCASIAAAVPRVAAEGNLRILARSEKSTWSTAVGHGGRHTALRACRDCNDEIG